MSHSGSVPLSAYALAMRCPVLIWRILLRARTTIHGTALAYGAICLRACYAMSGTEIAYDATYLCA
eukprot:1007711-Rhodomonas_salina.2